MPNAPPRTCSTCGKPGCTVHVRQPWQRTAPPPARIRGPKLQRLRKALFDKAPLCVLCQQAGRVSIAVIRDHVVNLEAGGQDIEENTQGLCEACHTLKTQEESKRGTHRQLK